MLNTPEDIIYEMIEVKFRHNQFTAKLFRKKLEFVEDRVREVVADDQLSDEERQDLYEMWRNNLYILWEKYSNIRDVRDYFVRIESAKPVNPLDELARYCKSTSSWSASSSSSGYGSSSSSSSRRNQRFPKPKPSYVPPLSDAFTHKGKRMSLEETRCEMEATFGLASPITDTHNMEQMHSFVAILSKADRLLSVHSGDFELRDDVFGYAIAKLPRYMRAHYGGGRHVRELKGFFLERLVEHYVDKMSREQLDYSPFYSCTYCKVDEHSKGECAKVRAMLCYECFESGHKAVECPRRHGDHEFECEDHQEKGA